MDSSLSLDFIGKLFALDSATNIDNTNFWAYTHILFIKSNLIVVKKILKTYKQLKLIDHYVTRPAKDANQARTHR